MKKLLFWLTIVFVLSACGAPASSINTPTSAFTQTPASTATPASAETPARPTEPYAVVSNDKAEFWFPLPDKQEWEWGFLTQGDDYIWNVGFGNAQDFAAINITCTGYGRGNPKILLKIGQTGSFEDMLKTCDNKILISSSGQPTTVDGFFTSSYSNGGLLIEITDPTWMQKLAKDKPQSIVFSVNQTTRITPSKTRPSTGSYAVILPNKADFWFQLPDRTEWQWNGPIQKGYSWGVHAGPNISINIIAQVYCGYDPGKPLQTGSFEELLKVCKTSFSDFITLSHIDKGLLIELTDPDLLESFNKDPSGLSIYFKDSDVFEVSPIYK